jgi:CheY-like chemotaxis protein
MARIIHVDDKLEWIDVVRRALANHWVDSARTYDKALQFIYGAVPYDLALVDLNLVGEDDRMGGELLDLLKEEFPSTRRVVVTASPPAGDLQTNVFERYALEAVIIKGKTTLPDLRMVVARALRRDADKIPQQVKILNSELMERYRDWRDRVEEQIRANVRDVHNKARDAGRLGGGLEFTAQSELDEWLRLQRRFNDDCGQLEFSVSAASTPDDVRSGMEQLEQVTIKFANEIQQLESKQSC